MNVRVTTLEGNHNCEDCGRGGNIVHVDISFGAQSIGFKSCIACYTRLTHRMVGSDGPRL